MKNDSGPAFPCRVGVHIDTAGMSLREWYAGLIAQGFCANPNLNLSNEFAIAESAFKIADAMIAESEKTDD